MDLTRPAGANALDRRFGSLWATLGSIALRRPCNQHSVGLRYIRFRSAAYPDFGTAARDAQSMNAAALRDGAGVVKLSRTAPSIRFQ